MVKVLFKISVFLLFLLSIGCTNEITDNLSTTDSKGKSIKVDSVLNAIELKEKIVQLMTENTISLSLIKEIHEGISHSLKFGLEESIRFRDMSSPQTSKIWKSDNKFKVLSYLISKYEVSPTQLSSEEFFNYLNNNDYQIYWPYSEDWDNKTIPTIIYTTSEENIGSTFVNKNNKFEKESIKLSNEYLKNNPTWIISQSSTKYDELPEFVNDEFINKNGVVFLSKYATEIMKSKLKSTTPGVYIDKINALQSFESNLTTGPELQFFWCHSDFLLGNAPTGYVNTYRYNMKIGEVGKDIQLDYLIRWTWPSREVTNSLTIYEKDGGKNKTATKTLLYNNWGTILNAKASFTYESNDDLVFDQIFEQKKIYGDDNYTASGELRQYKNAARDFWITLAVRR